MDHFERAQKLLITKLRTLSGGSSNTAIEILNKSTTSSWQDVYELKESGFGKSAGFRQSNQYAGEDIQFLKTGSE